MIYTYQDFEKARDDGKLTDFVGRVIQWHRNTTLYRNACIADEYDAERNTTILGFVKWMYSATGEKIKDDFSSNTKLTSNFFARLNTQRCLYSLGNGLTFEKEGISKKLGESADKIIKDAAYYALIHAESFLYWAYDHIHVFKLTEFAPLYDEKNGNLRAGVRFWQLDPEKPMYATLYAQEGYIDFESKNGGTTEFKPTHDKFQPYRMTVQEATATTGEVVTEHNYSYLPIVPLWGSRLQQSTLVGMRSKIDSFDMIFSGFANDLNDCAQIYWIINNAGGMTAKDMREFRERLLFRHMANVNTADGVDIKPYTQEVPHTARDVMLKSIRAQIYEDFGGLDVHTVAAGATNDHIEAAYQPLDEQADDFEYQIIEAVRLLLGLQDVSPEDATPKFKRNRISNQMELTQMIMMAAQYLDDESVLDKLPFLTPEEVKGILKRKDAEDLERIEEEPEEVIIDE